MTTSEPTCSRISWLISSDIRVVVTPDEVRQAIDYRFPEGTFAKCSKTYNLHSFLDDEIVEYTRIKDKTDVVLSSLYKKCISNGDIINLTEKVERLLLDNKNACEAKLKELFEDKKPSRNRGLPLGTLSIFSRDLIAYYDGKSWNKVTI